MIAPAELDALAARARTLAANVCDPEIPVVTIEELGILREVRAVPFVSDRVGPGAPQERGAGHVIEITITPTYSGCPAIERITDDILAEMEAEGIPARVKTRLSPAWTTDWIGPAAREKLRGWGIAPPGPAAHDDSPFATDSASTQVVRLHRRAQVAETVACPRCDSLDTTETSPFGSTACKSLWRCLACLEPFDRFKPY